MNLGEIQADIYDRTGQPAAPDTAVVNRFLRYIDETHRNILTRKGIGTRCRKALLTFSSVANNPFAVLPQAAVRVRVIVDRTNNRPLDELDLQDARLRDPGMNFTTSVPYGYFIDNLAASVALDPSDASSIWVKSDNAADSTQTAYIEGVVTGGYYQTASVALNGVTAVQFGALATWERITKFYIRLTASNASAVATGNIKLFEDSGVGTELARIPPGKSYPRYSRIHLVNTPSTSLTYYADVDLHVEKMTNYTDEPLIPEDFHWLISKGAVMMNTPPREKAALYTLLAGELERGIANLQTWLNSPTGVNWAQRRMSQWSQLGPYFVAGS